MSDFSKNKNGEKIVWFSQQHKYEMVDTEIVGYKESDILGGTDPYSASKSMAEISIKSYFKSYIKNSTPATNTAPKAS